MAEDWLRRAQEYACERGLKLGCDGEDWNTCRDIARANGWLAREPPADEDDDGTGGVREPKPEHPRGPGGSASHPLVGVEA